MEKPAIETTPSVETLSQHTFFVPAYQRGYRWTPDEVRELLDDIRQFAVRVARNPDEFYCIQPLVVRWKVDSGKWEVIDGQQRLTTIYLITRYINEMWRGRRKDPVLTLHYESRERTQEFLKELSVKDDGSVDFNAENIDFAHISKAYQAIAEWAKELGPRLNQDEFTSVFRRSVRVIWYEPIGSNSVKIFTRINSGKIPLTNAELIRGLFLKSSNFTNHANSDDNNELAQLKQMEISGQWDRMEAALHDDKFWYFLTDRDDPAETRIDLIFRLLTGIIDKDSYALFRAYSTHFPNGADVASVFAKWEEVKNCYQQLHDWYIDWDTYHQIGYLIETGTSLKTLWDRSRRLRKSKFQEALIILIQESLPKQSLDSLKYGDVGVKRVLLLHNILTTLESKERHFRFPFNRYKVQKWDVEHIHSVAERPPESESHQREWLKDAAEYMPDFEKEVTDFVKKSSWEENEFDSLYKEILKRYSERDIPESVNDLSNLALLDSGTNRGYGNAVFPAKRAKIIERERDGNFIPIATKNAFMKYYSKSVKEFTFWSEPDRKSYFEDIEKVMSTFFAPRK